MTSSEAGGAELMSLFGPLRAGDRDARERFFSILMDRVRPKAKKKLHGDRIRKFEETDDLVQETMLRTWKAIEASTAETLPELIKFAAEHMRRAQIDLVRHQFGRGGCRPLTITGNGGMSDGGSAPGFDDKVQSTAGPATLAECTEFHEVLVEKLPHDLCEVFKLRYYVKLTNAEVAEVLGVHENTVKKRNRQAVAKLGPPAIDRNLWVGGV